MQNKISSMEIWKEIKDYEGLYEVSNYGRIKSLDSNIILTPCKPATSGLCVTLSKNRVNTKFQVSRLVAAAFIPNPENKPYVDHIDGVKYHNFADNLRWCTQKENMNYKPARRNKIKYNCQIVGYGADGKECVRFDNYIEAEKRGMYRHLIKKSVDTGKPYKGILYKEEK